MFSPIVAIASAIAVSTVTLPTLKALILSTSAPASSPTCATIFTKPWNCSLRATKSVSELTSTIAALLAATAIPIKPSAATRPAFFAAFERPFLRSQSTAVSTSPLVSLRACLQSIMPAPVLSRRSFTIAAVIAVIVRIPMKIPPDGAPAADSGNAPGGQSAQPGGRIFRYPLFRFGGQRLRLCHPGIGTARQADFFADVMGSVVVELGKLPIVEDAHIVQALLDRARHAR